MNHPCQAYAMARILRLRFAARRMTRYGSFRAPPSFRSFPTNVIPRSHVEGIVIPRAVAESTNPAQSSRQTMDSATPLRFAQNDEVWVIPRPLSFRPQSRNPQIRHKAHK